MSYPESSRSSCCFASCYCPDTTLASGESDSGDIFCCGGTYACLSNEMCVNTTDISCPHWQIERGQPLESNASHELPTYEKSVGLRR